MLTLFILIDISVFIIFVVGWYIIDSPISFRTGSPRPGKVYIIVRSKTQNNQLWTVCTVVGICYVIKAKYNRTHFLYDPNYTFTLLLLTNINTSIMFAWRQQGIDCLTDSFTATLHNPNLTTDASNCARNVSSHWNAVENPIRHVSLYYNTAYK